MKLEKQYTCWIERRWHIPKKSPFLNEHVRYKRGLGLPENGVHKINSHQREALSLVTLLCTQNMSKYSGGGCVPLYIGLQNTIAISALFC